MPFCTQCGGTLDSGDRFCRECGREVRAATPVLSPRPASASRAIPLADDLSSREAADASRAPFLGSAGAQNPLSFSSTETDERPAQRPLFIIGFFFVVAMAGWAGYRWYSHPIPEGQAVEGTEQSLESPDGVSSARPTGATNRPGPQSAASAAGHQASPNGELWWDVIGESTTQTTDATHSLGAPDGRIVVIAAGGSLALARTKGPFYNGDGPDVRVHGPLGHRVPYTIFARNGPDEAWVRFDVNRRGFSDGTASHDFGHHGIARAQQIMVRNNGAAPLYLDAVTPLHQQPETYGGESSGHHRDEAPRHPPNPLK